MSDYGADPIPDLEKIKMVAEGYGLFPSPKTKVDQFSIAGGNKVYHMVKRLGSWRLDILVAPADIPG